MKTKTAQTLTQCLAAMMSNQSVLLSERLKDSSFCATQTINSIECDGSLTLFDEQFGVIYDVNRDDILIIINEEEEAAE